MLLSEMSVEEARDAIMETERVAKWGGESEEDRSARIIEVSNCLLKVIDFARNAKVISHEIKANRGKKMENYASEKYPGVYVHQTITISDGSHKFVAYHPEAIVQKDYNALNKMRLSTYMFGLWSVKHTSLSDRTMQKIMKAAPQIFGVYQEALNIRLEFTPEAAEKAADEYVNKTQGKAKAGIIKKMGTFLAECNLKDEDPEFLLQIMKFISRDNFWEMKNFFNYCRRNVGDINFLTPEEIIQAQNLAKAIEVQKS